MTKEVNENTENIKVIIKVSADTIEDYKSFYVFNEISNIIVNAWRNGKWIMGK